MIKLPINLHSYVSPEFFASEGVHFLKKSWVFVGLADEVAESGSYRPVKLWNQRFILTNDGGQYRLFRNICPHRGSEIVSTCGKGTFSCPYHGWAFNTSGRVTIANPRLFSEIEKIDLAALKCETVGNFIFASTECPVSLYEFLGETVSYLNFVSENMNSRIDTNFMSIEANWKINVENTLESYHLGKVHPTSLAPHFAGESTTEIIGRHSSVVEKLKPSFKTALKHLKKSFFTESNFDDYKHTLIFPNLTIASSGFTNFFIQGFYPTGAGQCEFVSHGFLPAFQNTVRDVVRKQLVEASIAFNRKVFGEDKLICEGVQRGMESLPLDYRLFCYPSAKEDRYTNFIRTAEEMRS